MALNNQALRWAVSQQNPTAAGTTSGIAVSLPQGATGKPMVLKAVGNVSGYVTLTYGNSDQVVASFNANQGDEKVIPATAFRGPTNAVVVSLYVSAAGSATISVGFA